MKHITWVLILSLFFIIPQFATASNIPELNTPHEISYWMQTKLIYIRDFPKSYTQRPYETLDLKTGDCEDYALLSQFFLKRIGIESQLLSVMDLDKKLPNGHVVCVFPKKNPTHYFTTGEIKDYPGSYIRLAEKFYKKWTDIEEWTIDENNKVSIKTLHHRESLYAIALNKRLAKEIKENRDNWKFEHPEEWKLIQKFNNGDTAGLPEEFKNNEMYAVALCPKCSAKLPGDYKCGMDQCTGSYALQCVKCGHMIID